MDTVRTKHMVNVLETAIRTMVAQAIKIVTAVQMNSDIAIVDLILILIWHS